jgi:glycosyltransferase involved in cell wall biosynthesis
VGVPWKVSVALATYDGARYLRAQLESIAAQTRVPDELVVGDDGSTDATADIVAEFARTGATEVRFTRNATRLGSTGNFVACLERCRGDVVLLCDQDDVWLPRRVERTLEALEARPEAAYAFSDGALMDGGGAPLPGRLWERAFFDRRGQELFHARRGVEVLLRTNVVTGATMGIRRDRLGSALPIPPGWVHDAWLAFVLELQHGGVPIPEPLIRYRVHSAQQIGVLRPTPRAVLALASRHDAAFYRSQARNYRALAERVAALGAPGAERAAAGARGKAESLEARAAFRERPGRAAGGFARAVLRGDYDRFGLGKKQALFDLAGALWSALRRAGGGEGGAPP